MSCALAQRHTWQANLSQKLLLVARLFLRSLMFFLFVLTYADNDYYNSGDDEFGFDDVDTHETQLPIDKLDLYIQSENTYTRYV